MYRERKVTFVLTQVLWVDVCVCVWCVGVDKYKHVLSQPKVFLSSQIKIITRRFNKLIIATRHLNT